MLPSPTIHSRSHSRRAYELCFSSHHVRLVVSRRIAMWHLNVRWELQKNIQVFQLIFVCQLGSNEFMMPLKSQDFKGVGGMEPWMITFIGKNCSILLWQELKPVSSMNCIFTSSSGSNGNFHSIQTYIHTFSNTIRIYTSELFVNLFRSLWHITRQHFCCAIQKYWLTELESQLSKGESFINNKAVTQNVWKNYYCAKCRLFQNFVISETITQFLMKPGLQCGAGRWSRTLPHCPWKSTVATLPAYTWVGSPYTWKSLTCCPCTTFPCTEQHSEK